MARYRLHYCEEDKIWSIEKAWLFGLKWSRLPLEFWGGNIEWYFTPKLLKQWQKR